MRGPLRVDRLRSRHKVTANYLDDFRHIEQLELIGRPQERRIFLLRSIYTCAHIDAAFYFFPK
jgi:hypothetical protein